MTTIQQQQFEKKQINNKCTKMELDNEEAFSEFEIDSIAPEDKKYFLLCQRFKAIVPGYFIKSCYVFKNMFKVTYSHEDDNIYPITNEFSRYEFENYCKFYNNIFELQVKNNQGNKMSYLDYITNHSDEYIKRYTNNNAEPPHCNALADIYEKYENEMIKILYMDKYYDNPYLQKGVMLCITCFIKSVDKKLDTEKKECYLSRQTKVDELVKDIVDNYEDSIFNDHITINSKIIYQLKYHIPKKEFKEGLIDLIYKKIDNKKELEFEKYIQIGNSEIFLKDSSYYNCINLKSIIIADSVISIGNKVFENCISLNSINIPKLVKYIGSYAFYRCYNLKSINIPESLTFIEDGVFSCCNSLTLITIPNSVTHIRYCAFWKCYSLISITIPDSVTYIGYGVFSNCYSLISIDIPNTITTINESAFEYCNSLQNITIPNSVKCIESEAFLNCYSLTYISIPQIFESFISDIFNDVELSECEIIYT